ncbi:MAG: DUF4147 domain-containing protein [Thermomicrobiales bacterium]
MSDWSEQHRLIEQLFTEGLTAVEPRSVVRRNLTYSDSSLSVSDRTLAVNGRLVVLAIGKAAGAMALGAIDVLGNRIDLGIALSKDDHFEDDIPGFECYEARHPLPDQRGIDATSRILQACTGLTHSDTVIALISGGGSALLEAPASDISLKDFQQMTDLLLRAGAPIQHLNAVRSAISRVKGGGLRRAIGDATCVSLILSDVLGNDPSVIASGPTVYSVPDVARASGLVDQYGITNSIPESVRRVLASPPQELPHFDLSGDVWQIIADNRWLVESVRSSATTLGLASDVIWTDVEGEARELGVQFVRSANAMGPEIDLVLGGGEATVKVTGSGTGGRNTEFALAAAIELSKDGPPDWVVASIGTDGQDGSADAAGAIADPDSVQRARSIGLSASDFLRENDSAGFFGAIEGLVRTGPTGTNVNDLYVAVRRRRSTRSSQSTGERFPGR